LQYDGGRTLTWGIGGGGLRQSSYVAFRDQLETVRTGRRVDPVVPRVGPVVTSTLGNDPPTIRIVIAEDQALVRRGAALLISLEPDMEVVGQASNGVEAVELAQLLRPDVILMDLHMPLKGGVAATREITQALPNTQVLVLTTLSDDETVFEAVRAGAQAYLLKDAAESELLETIRALRRGESRLTPQIARKVMDQFRRLAQEPQSDGYQRAKTSAPQTPTRPEHGNEIPSTEVLNDKEERVLQLIAEGMSNRQIAETLFLAEGTIKNYVSRIMEKLHANTRTGLAIISRSHTEFRRT
jgi:DNA-binding NarL/FixJ family response regulator